MILYYPLSNFLTLFANTLQSPQDPQAFSDLKLMEMVISLLSDPAFHVNVPTTNTAQLFVELSSVARKLANKANPDIARLKKCSRGEDEDKPHDDVSAHDSETVSGLENPGLQSCSTVSTPRPSGHGPMLFLPLFCLTLIPLISETCRREFTNFISRCAYIGRLLSI